MDLAHSASLWKNFTGHVRGVEFLEVGQAELLEVLLADEADDVVQQEHAVNGGEGLALERVPFLEEAA